MKEPITLISDILQKQKKIIFNNFLYFLCKFWAMKEKNQNTSEKLKNSRKKFSNEWNSSPVYFLSLDYSWSIPSQDKSFGFHEVFCKLDFINKLIWLGKH